MKIENRIYVDNFVL